MIRAEEQVLSPREQRHQEVRAQVLEHAREIMRAEGAGALSWNELARRVGIKPPSLYVYFDDKMAVYDALFRQGWEMYREHMDRAMAGMATGWEQARVVSEAHFQFCLDNPDLFQIMFERPIPGFEPSAESLAVSFGALESGRLHFGELAAAEGVELFLPPEQLFELWIAAVHGITAQHLANQPDLPLGEGRFGSLIPVLVQLFRSALSAQVGIVETTTSGGNDDSSDV